MLFPQSAMAFGDEPEPVKDVVQLHHVIQDQGSKYSVTVGRVCGREDLKAFMKRLVADKEYKKATHHSYGVRFSHQGQLWESKRDDGETGAGMVILRMIKKYNMVNTVVVVTRWYGGVKLFNERFRHVQDAAEQGIQAALHQV